MPTRDHGVPRDLDRRAVQQLLNRYWGRGGLRGALSRTESDEELEAEARSLRAAGLMFDEDQMGHDAIVARALTAVGRVDCRAVADAFVASLTSRRLDLRSALGSFAVLHRFPAHAGPADRRQCPTCGEPGGRPSLFNANRLSFERFKWGGVRHDQPSYAGFDLEQFAAFTRPPVAPADVDALNRVLDAIDTAPPRTTSAALEKRLAGVVPSNKAERDTLIGILGLCGVLGTAAHPGYRRAFVPHASRTLPDRHHTDTAYPACWWRRSDGVSDDAIRFWFGHLL